MIRDGELRRSSRCGVAVLTLAVTLLASACGSAGAPAAGRSGGAPSSVGGAATTPGAGGASAGTTYITACIPARTNTTLPLFVAQDAGYFAAHHIDATLPYFAGQRIDSALVAGQCDVALDAGAEGPVLKGFPARVVAVTTTHIPFQIWGRPELTSMDQLKGKTIGTSGAGSLSYRVGNYLLGLNHLVPNKDVTEVSITDSAATLAALVSGRIAAAVLSPPLTFEAKAKGMKLLFSAPPSEAVIVQTIVTTQSYLSAHPDVVTGVIQAVVQAMEKLRAERDFYGRELTRFNHLQLSPSQLEEYWSEDRSEYNLPPRGTHVEAVRALRLYGGPSKNVDLDKVADSWLDMSIVNRLYGS